MKTLVQYRVRWKKWIKETEHRTQSDFLKGKNIAKKKKTKEDIVDALTYQV